LRNTLEWAGEGAEGVKPSRIQVLTFLSAGVLTLQDPNYYQTSPPVAWLHFFPSVLATLLSFYNHVYLSLNYQRDYFPSRPHSVIFPCRKHLFPYRKMGGRGWEAFYFIVSLVWAGRR